MSAEPRPLRLGLIGARGHTGRTLLSLLAGHGRFELALASSRALAGQPVRAMAQDLPTDLCFENLSPDAIAERELDAVVLALPNAVGAPFSDAIIARRPDTVLLDLSADHRFDNDWVYGLPEFNRAELRGARRIANPGCYATAIQLVVRPLQDAGLIAAGRPPTAFGVSGYSGAGTTPSPNNDPEHLADNLIAYRPIGHMHEREVTHRLGRPVRFSPHVAAFFRGILVTVHIDLSPGTTRASVDAAYENAFETEPLVDYLGATAPEPRDRVGTPGAQVGGVSVSRTGDRAVVVGTLDNLMKGAASQALQNLNLSCGLAELRGLT